MTWNCQSVASEAVEDLSAELCRVLEEQIMSVREGNLAQVELSSVRADAIIAKMTPEGTDKPSLSDGDRERLKRLYAELVLTLRAEHADVQTRLKQLRQVKRAVGAYGGKIRP